MNAKTAPVRLTIPPLRDGRVEIFENGFDYHTPAVGPESVPDTVREILQRRVVRLADAKNHR
ncbi:MAG: hypothetical protein QOE70_716 [Chthoniobacter sp.]|jgi:hypothetical protein|nr:hypothetical protein [Chthoniobacter sp.]